MINEKCTCFCSELALTELKPHWCCSLGIHSVGAGIGDVTAMIRDPQGGQNTVEVMIEDRGNNTYVCMYKPTQVGLHTITLTFGGVEIPRSPFNVLIEQGEFLKISRNGEVASKES